MKKRRLKKSAMIIIGALAVALFLVIININFSFIGKRSIHEDAKRYKTRHCLMFYPDSDLGLKKAREFCKGVKDDSVHDYMLVPFGDHYLVSYGQDKSYFATRDYQPVTLKDPDEKGMAIIDDYLRYACKKDHPDIYYDVSSFGTFRKQALQKDNMSFSLSQKGVDVSFAAQDVSVQIPLQDAQLVFGMDFGFPQELYRKPVYIDPDEQKHPIICLTFDDGPHFWYESGDSPTVKIVDLLEEYDCNATFYVIGNNLENREVWTQMQAHSFLERSIGNGNEYGSHTQSHVNVLTDLPDQKAIRQEIEGPIAFMKSFLGYEMKTYRPVEGTFDDDVLAAQPACAVLWDVDSEDWALRDGDAIYERMMDTKLDSGDILIFHDIYEETAEALEKLIPELVSQGYQLVTVSDMMEYYGLDINNTKYIYSANDWN